MAASSCDREEGAENWDRTGPDEGAVGQWGRTPGLNAGDGPRVRSTAAGLDASPTRTGARPHASLVPTNAAPSHIGMTLCSSSNILVLRAAVRATACRATFLAPAEVLDSRGICCLRKTGRGRCEHYLHGPGTARRFIRIIDLNTDRRDVPRTCATWKQVLIRTLPITASGGANRGAHRVLGGEHSYAGSVPLARLDHPATASP